MFCTDWDHLQCDGKAFLERHLLMTFHICSACNLCPQFFSNDEQNSRISDITVNLLQFCLLCLVHQDESSELFILIQAYIFFSEINSWWTLGLCKGFFKNRRHELKPHACLKRVLFLKSFRSSSKSCWCSTRIIGTEVVSQTPGSEPHSKNIRISTLCVCNTLARGDYILLCLCQELQLELLQIVWSNRKMWIGINFTEARRHS